MYDDIARMGTNIDINITDAMVELLVQIYTKFHQPFVMNHNGYKVLYT